MMFHKCDGCPKSFINVNQKKNHEQICIMYNYLKKCEENPNCIKSNILDIDSVSELILIINGLSLHKTTYDIYVKEDIIKSLDNNIASIPDMYANIISPTNPLIILRHEIAKYNAAWFSINDLIALISYILDIDVNTVQCIVEIAQKSFVQYTINLQNYRILV